MRVRETGRRAAAGTVLAACLLTSGCGVAPSGVEDGGMPPTGLASGPTLYFVDGDGQLVPSRRDAGRLGTVLGAVQLLLADSNPMSSDLHSEISPTTTRPVVEDAGNYVTIHLPLTSSEISPLGIDQVICTAAAVIAGSGRDAGSVQTTVRMTDGKAIDRPCPVID